MAAGISGFDFLITTGTLSQHLLAKKILVRPKKYWLGLVIKWKSQREIFKGETAGVAQRKCKNLCLSH